MDPSIASDPATADALARFYDLDLRDDPGDLDLYLALAERTGGPILELGAGTGRLAVPLAAAGDRVSAVDLAGMDIVEVSPPYDQAETTAMAANRVALEAISALAVRRRAGGRVRWKD